MNFNSRERLPFLLNEMGLLGLGVEVGVQRGVNASHIRWHWNGEKFYGVDPWEPYEGVVNTKEMHDAYYADACAALDRTGKPFELFRLKSLEAAPKFADVSLDFVYLDGDHFHDALVADIEAWWSKVKTGGIVAGHDYVTDGWHRNGDAINGYPTPEEAGVERGHCGPFGVISAVKQLFGPGGKYEREVHLTSPDTDMGWRSWLVIK